jgi:GntP family gluconate:H+ symporter
MHIPAVPPPQQVVSYWPFAVLAITVALVVFLITVMRVHAFLALILAAIAAGLLAGRLPGEPETSHWIQAVELTTTEFGVTAGKISLVIALASVIGMCLMESGAADKVVRRFLAAFGEKRAGFALFTSSYILSMPIFFDTFFMLLLPIARALAIRTGKNYTLFVMAICCGGVVTHGVVAPHPGPLAMAETLKIDLGLTILAGIVVGIIPAIGSWWVARWINWRMDIPVRETPGTTMAELEQILAKREEELPSFTWSILPVILPIALISAASFLAAFSGKSRLPHLYPWVEFWGNRNVALFVGAVIAMWVLARQKGYSVGRICRLIGPPFETAGVIILITSAGGAFGLMLKNAGVGDAIKAAAAGHSVNCVLLAYGVACVIRIAQGSMTVAMLTTSAMMVPILEGGAGLPYHPIYIFLAIGFGSAILSWMNDSGFWVISKLSGFTEMETLKSWTVISTTVSVVGLIATLTGATLFPFAPR